MSVMSLVSSFKALHPFKRASTFTGVFASQSASFSNAAARLAEQPPSERPQIGASSLFENVQVEAEETLTKTGDKPVDKEYRWSSTNFKTSPRKLNMIARQLRNLPIDEAIKQLEFSPKRSAKKIMHNLAFAKKNAQDQKGLTNLVVAQAWVGKGRYIQRIKPHARGQFGIVHRKEAHMKFLLKELDPKEEALKSQRRNVRGWHDRKKVWTPLAENKPIYNPKPFYNW
ncbi:ribosomal protein L22/L17 [Radiomyces spectabilis]|uniref:ribosomal protein L22/L17 n=1 Tax=Radiomyces spectabilis TaxID=64574 RepID=UPI00221EE680|nr:ribosomal protein L22/L17 [Radiomyces spectabilis]KAI8391201.1 ribosomal protein L22/L17 [Radiomyces spectabilis]